MRAVEEVPEPSVAVGVGIEDARDGTLQVLVRRPSVVVDPPKLMRMAWSSLAVLDALAPDGLDGAGRARLADLWRRLVEEVGSTLTDEAVEELHRLLPHDVPAEPTAGELRILHAQLVGWLYGVLNGEELSTWGAAVAGAQRLAETIELRRASHRPAGATPPSPYL